MCCLVLMIVVVRCVLFVVVCWCVLRVVVWCSSCVVCRLLFVGVC